MSQYYLLLENQREGLKQLYSGPYKKLHVEYLFDHTELAGLKKHGPIVAAVDNADLSALRATLKENNGWIITTGHDFQDLLAHLRHTVIVYMNNEQTGIFRYYDATISQYFFSRLNQSDTADWLGPISRIEWFGNSWRHRVSEANQWHHWDNPQADRWRYDGEKSALRLRLAPRHHQSLQTMQIEKFAWIWRQNRENNSANAAIDKVIVWVREGIDIGLWQDDDLNHYLAMRSAYPNILLPQQWPGESIKARLDYLLDYFKRTYSANESFTGI